MSIVTGKKKPHHSHFWKVEKGRPRKLQTIEPHLCTWEHHVADTHGSNVKVHRRKGGYLRQLAQPMTSA